VYTWSRRAGLQPCDAADVVQEVMRSVARNIKTFHHDRAGDTFRGWLRRITQYRIADFRRQRGRDPAPPVGGSSVQARLQQQVDPIDEEVLSDAPGGVIPPDKRRDLANVKSEFSSRNWQIFWRVVVEEQDTADVAREFGVSANVVRLAKSRILKRLRETINPSSQDDER
jgi:RNA polymerase sigma-70 factor (ECF subfamily)